MGVNPTEGGIARRAEAPTPLKLPAPNVLIQRRFKPTVAFSTLEFRGAQLVKEGLPIDPLSQVNAPRKPKLVARPHVSPKGPTKEMRLIIGILGTKVCEDVSCSPWRPLPQLLPPTKTA